MGDVLIWFLVREVRMLIERLLEALYEPVEWRVLRRWVELADHYPGPDGVPEITLTPTRASACGKRRRARIPRPGAGRVACYTLACQCM